MALCENWITVDDLDDCHADAAAASADVKTQAVTAASEILYSLSGSRWPGSCEETIRPCLNKGTAWYAAMWPSAYGWWPADWPTPPLACQCSSAGGCGCADVPQIPLGRDDVTEVTNVTINGTVLAGTSYRLDEGYWLVRTDGAGWPCFPAGTMVLTSTGMKPIETIEAGEMVLTHQNRWRKVVRSGKTGDSETVLVKGRGGSIRCTPDHQFWSAELVGTDAGTGRHKLGSPEWTQATDLVGRTWAMPNNVESLDIPLPENWTWEELPANFWHFVGRWVGDGWTSAPKKPGVKNWPSVLICAGKHEADDLAQLLNATGWDWLGPHDQRTSIRYKLGSPSLRAWLRDQFGTKAYNKRIPPWLLGAPTEIRQAFLDGYVAADGWVKPGSSTRAALTSVHTVSHELALTLKLLVASLGFAPTMYEGQKSTHVEGRPVNAHQPYRVDWSHVPPDGPYAQAWSDDMNVWGRVRSVELSEDVVPVYDLEVEEDHSFIADGFVVHNCCQNLANDLGEQDTWSVTFTFGATPPEAGKLAATSLAAELILGCVGSSECRIPNRATTVTREGVTYALLDPQPFLEARRTGLYEVDLWLAAVNPASNVRRARIFSPDVASARRVMP